MTETFKTTHEHSVGDIWFRRVHKDFPFEYEQSEDESDYRTDVLVVTGKFNDYCLEMRDETDTEVGVYPLHVLKDAGWTRRPR